MKQVAAIGSLAIALFAALVAFLQVNLTPIDPLRATSVEHQVRQDDAIMALDAIVREHEVTTDSRLTRMERLEDGTLAALILLLAGQVWELRQRRR